LAIGGYKVLEINQPGAGQYYPSYCEQWMTWIVSNNPEINNYGPVHFLHGMSCQETAQGGGYGVQPVVRIGGQAITIKPGEYVFLPIINSAAETIDSGVPDNPAALLNYVRADLEEGDNPLDNKQVIIARDPDPADHKASALKDEIGKKAVQVLSNVFPLYVPPAQQGASLLRTCFDTPINTEGVRNCVVGGWWMLIKFTGTGNTYYIRSFAKGRGHYQAAMFYQINVSNQANPARTGVPPPDWSKSMIESLIKKKKDDGVIDNVQYDSIVKKILI
jgi:hypothetical protein